MRKNQIVTQLKALEKNISRVIVGKHQIQLLTLGTLQGNSCRMTLPAVFISFNPLFFRKIHTFSY